ncbi:MAG: hypothetical protein ACI9UN_005208 [Granulosicoccus sp.]|jgi:hypothetical protein
MSDIVYGAIIGTCSVLAVLLWLRRIEQKIQTIAPINEGSIRVSTAYRCFVLLLIALVAISAQYLLQLDGQDDFEHTVLYIFVAISIVFVLQMFIDAFLLTTSFDDKGLIGKDVLQRETLIGWADIETVNLDTTFNVFIVNGKNKKIRFSKFCEEIYSLLQKLETHSPAQASTEAVTIFLEKNSKT